MIAGVDQLGLRLYLLLDVVIPLVFFMAAIYLGLHVVFARLGAAPDGTMMWFFGVVTGPLTRPVRKWLAAGTPEARVRLVALGAYAALWLVSRVAFAVFGPARAG